MTGATIKALEPVIATRQRAAGLHRQARLLQQLPHLAGRLHLPDAAGHAGARWPTRGKPSTLLLRQRAYLQQIVHQTTHSLARFFLEVDANYKQFKTASRLRAAAAQRLEAQRAYYEEGRITIDRFLDAVSQYAQAVATEAQYKTTYNISIVALEEAKGTLLAYNNIAVAEGPHAAEGLRPGPRHPGRPQAGSRSRTTGRCTGSGSRARRIPTRSRRTRRPTSSPAIIRCSPAPVGPLGPPPTPLPPYRPAGEPPILSQAPAGPGSGTPAAGAPKADASAMPVSATVTPAAAREALPRSVPANLGPQPPVRTIFPAGNVQPSTAPSPEPADELPVLPEAINLPPLPR